MSDKSKQLVDGAEVPPGVTLYDPEDYAAHRRLIYDGVKETLMKQYPKVYNGIRMELSDVDYADPDDFSIADQKKALHDDGYLHRRLRGTITLYDEASGTELDRKTMTLMRVPHLTNRGTFIRGGNEWISLSQQRLLPGAYTREQSNGELETQFNVRPGTGNAFRINFSPVTSQYRITLKGSDLHLYSLLKDLGVPDSDLQNQWGEEIFRINAGKYDSRTLDKAYNKLVPDWERSKNPGRSHEEKARMIKEALERSQVAARAVRRTLPNLFDMAKSASWRNNGEAMKKLAAFSRGELEELAAYITSVSGTVIDLEGTKDELEERIRKAVGMTTTSPDAGNPAGMPGAAAMIRQKKVSDGIIKKINQLYYQ